MFRKIFKKVIYKNVGEVNVVKGIVRDEEGGFVI